MQEIINYLANRGVEYLVHFTPVENLYTIQQYGIVPRSELERSGEDFVALDDVRHDGKDRSCFTISFPNYTMMYRYRKEQNKYRSDVAVLFIPIEELNNFSNDQVLFYSTNAASNTSVEQRKSCSEKLKAVENLFGKSAWTKSHQNFYREGANLPSYFTTDPQAEVQIAGTIPWSAVRFLVMDARWVDIDWWRIQLQKDVFNKYNPFYKNGLDIFSYPQEWEPMRA